VRPPKLAFAAAAIAFLAAAPAHANLNELFTELFGRPREPRVRVGYEFRQWKAREMKTGGGPLAFRQQLVDLSIPLKSTDDEKWRLDLGGRLDEPRTEAQFGNGRAIPNRLWDVGAGLSYSRQLEADRALAFSFQLATNGDEPFRHGRDVTAQANLLYKRPAPGPEAAWLFALNFSTNRNFANYIPIPGFAYFFRPTESLRLALGVPFFTALWNPVPKAILNVSYFPLNNAQARFSYFFFGPAQAYAQVRYQTKNFLTADRVFTRERLFYEEAVVQAGLTSPVSRSLSFDLYGGVSFDRKFFFGRRTTDKQKEQVLRPNRGPFGALRLIASF
jgi:hypothetical protein